MHGGRGVHVHCDVPEYQANFYVLARRPYASDVCLPLQRREGIQHCITTFNVRFIYTRGYVL